MKLHALIGTALVSLTLAFSGCGRSEAHKQPTAKRDPVLYVTSFQVYFCTKTTCPRAATAAQMKEISRRVVASSLMKEMHFVSSETLRRQHPDGLAGLGLIPPYPNSLTIVPKRAADAQEIANLFRHSDPGIGIYTVFYYYAFR
jgi:hypothetical protein